MQTEPRQIDVLVLAYLGDAIYELAVRNHVIASGGITRADRLHRAGVSYVKAEAQAKALLAMIDAAELTAEEEALARRAHNHKIATKPKNADPVTYKWATAFEALLGFLDLSGRKDRLQYIIQRAIEITEAGDDAPPEKNNA